MSVLRIDPKTDGVSDHPRYIITELLSGGDLFSFIKYKGGRLEDLTAAAITRQVLLAVEYLHNENIVHRISSQTTFY